MITSRAIYYVILLFMGLSAGFSVWAYLLGDPRDLLNFSVSIVGFSIAVLALFVAVRTYASIDSVNSISKMDGNILDNELYTTSLPEIINDFKETSVETLQKRVLSTIDDKLNRECRTATQFADSLQYLIDLLVIFPAIFNSETVDKKKYSNQMSAILAKLEKQFLRLQTLSQGNVIQIQEAIKLFRGVVIYQQRVLEGRQDMYGELLFVRGPILRNPVTRTVYYNYLGLYYNKKSIERICRSIGKADLHTIAGVERLLNSRHDIQPEEKERIEQYLESALQYFSLAEDASEGDAMWPAFVHYNKARTLYYYGLISSDVSSDAWRPEMRQAIGARSRVNQLIEEILGTKTVDGCRSHLTEFFQYQEELARLVKMNFECSLNPEGPLEYRGRDVRPIISDKNWQLVDQTPSFPKAAVYRDALVETIIERNVEL